jgi:hypothetical protein
MFGFVYGIITNLPSVTKQQAIKNFLRQFHIEHESVRSLETTFDRMRKELFEEQRSNETEGREEKKD